MNVRKKAIIRNALIITAIYAVLGMVLIIFIVKYQNDLGRKAAIESQQKVTTRISGLDVIILQSDHENHYLYNLAYEYYTEDGTRYSGTVGSINTLDKEYAQSFIGKEIEIYIDGKGNSIAVSDAIDFDVDYYKNWVIAIGAVIAAYTAIWIMLAARGQI